MKVKVLKFAVSSDKGSKELTSAFNSVVKSMFKGEFSNRTKFTTLLTDGEDEADVITDIVEKVSKKMKIEDLSNDPSFDAFDYSTLIGLYNWIAEKIATPELEVKDDEISGELAGKFVEATKHYAKDASNFKASSNEEKVELEFDTKSRWDYKYQDLIPTAIAEDCGIDRNKVRFDITQKKIKGVNHLKIVFDLPK